MPNKIKQEKGIAMVIALMLLLVMSVMVAGFMLTITSERKLGNNQARHMEALNVAEAGISEMSARLSLVSGDPSYIGEGEIKHPTWQARIVNSNSVPVAPANSNIDYYSSIQTAANPLAYTVEAMSTSDSTYVLTARYKTIISGTDTSIYYYNHSTGEQTAVSFPYSAPDDKSTPVWVIRSTGIRGNSRRSLEVEVSKAIISCNVKASLQTNANIFFRGAGGVCGHNHPSSLWPRTGDPTVGAGSAGKLTYCHSGANTPYELCVTPTHSAAGCLPSIATSPTATLTGPQGNNCVVNGDPATAANVPYKPIWTMLGFADSISMKTAYGFTLITDPSTLTADDIDGKALEFDCELDRQDVIGKGINPSGIWWLKRGLQCAGGGNENMTFKGLFFTEGGMHISGQFWCLGAMVCNGDISLGGVSGGPAPVNLTGQIDVLYSSEALQEVLAQVSTTSGLKQLAWREVNIH